MPKLNAGLQIRSATPSAARGFIVQAETAGIGQVWSTMGVAAFDPLGVFAAVAGSTSTIKLGSSIVPIYPRHPSALASQALTVEGLAPGRLRLGIGPSHKASMEGQLGLAMGNPLDYLREYLAVLRALLWDGKVDFDGVYFRVHTAVREGVAPRTPIPISALRANAFRLAGEIADGAISWMCPPSYLLDVALPAMTEGAKAAGRPRPPLIAHVPVALSTDREAVRTAAHAQIDGYGHAPYYAAMFADAGHPVGPNGEASDELIDHLVVSGEPETIADRLAALQASGVDELLVSHFPIKDEAAEQRELFSILAG